MFHVQRCCRVHLAYLEIHTAAFPAKTMYETVIYNLSTLYPALWTRKEQAPCPWQRAHSLAQSMTVYNGTACTACTASRGSCLVECMLVVGLGLQTSCISDPGKKVVGYCIGTLASCRHSGFLLRPWPSGTIYNIQYTAVVQTICSVNYRLLCTHIDCAPQLFAAERDTRTCEPKRVSVCVCCVCVQCCTLLYCTLCVFQGGGKLEGPACSPRAAATCSSSSRPSSPKMAEEQEPPASSLREPLPRQRLLHLPRFPLPFPTAILTFPHSHNPTIPHCHGLPTQASRPQKMSSASHLCTASVEFEG
jgi:hypothetical protein